MSETPLQDDHPTAVNGKKVIGLFILLFVLVAVPLTWWLHGGGAGVHDQPRQESPDEPGDEQGEPSDGESEGAPLEDVVEDTSSL
jgi:hypothetical protein